MKAIHNYLDRFTSIKCVGNYKLKYNFESDSQQNIALDIIAYVGNYKLKYNFESDSQLLARCINSRIVGNYKLKYNFESDSQPAAVFYFCFPGWEL